MPWSAWPSTPICWPFDPCSLGDAAALTTALSSGMLENELLPLRAKENLHADLTERNPLGETPG